MIPGMLSLDCLCVCVSLFLVSASSDLGPMFKVSFSAFLRCECSSSRPLDTFSFILNALADCIVRKGTMLEEWKNGAIRISFVYFTISRELCQCVSSTQQLLFVGTRIGNAICSSIYLSECLSVCPIISLCGIPALKKAKPASSASSLSSSLVVLV